MSQLRRKTKQYTAKGIGCDIFSCCEEKIKLPIILLSIGAGLALLIFLISWIAYDKVYFFNGYAITTVGWIASFLLVVLGIVFSVLAFTTHKGKIDKRQLIALLSLVAVVPVILICSALINGEKNVVKKTSPASYSSSYSSGKMSESKKEELAKQAALSALLKELKNNSKYSSYNIKDTRYDVGEIDNNNSSMYSHKVYGKLYLYDKYGNISASGTFEIPVDVKESGSTKAGNVYITIKKY